MQVSRRMVVCACASTMNRALATHAAQASQPSAFEVALSLVPKVPLQRKGVQESRFLSIIPGLPHLLQSDVSSANHSIPGNNMPHSRRAAVACVLVSVCKSAPAGYNIKTQFRLKVGEGPCLCGQGQASPQPMNCHHDSVWLPHLQARYTLKQSHAQGQQRHGWREQAQQHSLMLRSTHLAQGVHSVRPVVAAMVPLQGCRGGRRRGRGMHEGAQNRITPCLHFLVSG